MVEHNTFCTTLHLYNKFWSKLYLAFVLMLLPTNLMWMQQFFFEQLEPVARIFIGFTISVWLLQIFFIQLAFARMSQQSHKTVKMLSKIQWRLNGWPFRLNNKIKLMTYFERLSSNRKIGVTIGPTIVLTLPVFAQVLFIYRDGQRFYQTSGFLYLGHA